MRSQGSVRVIRVFSAAILLLTGTLTGAADAGSGINATGGVYRTAVESFDQYLNKDLDPTSEYTSLAFGLLSQTLVRNLVSYRHVSGTQGNVVRPDLATGLGKVSADRLTYTFTLKAGIRFGPPVSRPITSHDVEYAFERLETRSASAGGYPFYFERIVGFKLHAWPPTDISGIQTPDDETVIFHLTQPTPDFLHRLALPATAPIPPEVGGCFREAASYGRDIVSSGPYMIQGAELVDITSCATIAPMSGWDPTDHLVLVRNPDYDPTTDDPAVRENFIDGVDIGVDPDTADIFARIKAGLLDGSLVSVPPVSVVEEYVTDPSLAGLLHSDAQDGTYYLTMNLLVPPFDDVHVRKAINWAMNKRKLMRKWGGSAFGRIATHAFPPTLAAAGYDPYPSTGHAGDLVAAHAEMALSEYDVDGDGYCDAAACLDVRLITSTRPFDLAMLPAIKNAFANVGITLSVRRLEIGLAYERIMRPSNLIPLAAFPGWLKDYADAATFADWLFHSQGISCESQYNYAEVGMTQTQATECGVLSEWQNAQPPSLDAQIEVCDALTGAARSTCWAGVDEAVMEDVVPWVPLRWPRTVTIVGPNVTAYVYDQFGSMISLCHIAMA